MSQYTKPVCFNAIEAMKRIDELEAENERLRKDVANLQIRCRIAEEDNKANG